MEPIVIRVFISSTFRDLDEERNYLVRKVFPETNEFLDDKQVNEIDLRWGITDEQSRQKRVVDLCLKYLYESRPFFVGIIGERYGSIASPNNIELSPLVEEVYPRIHEDLNKGLSITEIEIINGALRATEDNRPHAIFFVKHTDIPYDGEDDEKFLKLQDLKQRILNQTTYPVYEYKELKDLDKVRDFILEKLGEPFNQTHTKSHDEIQIMYNQCFKQLNAYRNIVPDNLSILDQLMPYIERAKPLTVLEGMEGAGKSTLVAQLGQNYNKTDRLFVHLYGNVVNIPATNSMFVSFFLYTAKQILQKQYENKSSQKGIKGWVVRNFKKVNLDIDEELVWLIGQTKWCVVLDDIGSIRLHTISPMLYILPVIENGFAYIEQRFHIKVDYRILVVQNTNSIYNLSAGNFEKYIMPLGNTIDATKFINNYLSRYSKSLTKEQFHSLQNSLIRLHPRSLTLMLKYMREWGSHKQMTQFTQQVLNYNKTTDVYSLFIMQARNMIDNDGLRKLAGLITIFSYGIKKLYLFELSGISNNYNFDYAWSCLSKLTYEEPNGAIHWLNDSIANYISDAFNLNDKSFKLKIAQECYEFIGKRIKPLYTPEKFFESINKNPYLYLNCFTDSFPESLRLEYHEKIQPMRIKALKSMNPFSDDMYKMLLLAFLKDKGCFQIDYIKKYVYPIGLWLYIHNGLELERWKTTRTKGEKSIDFFKSYSAKFLSNNYETIAYWRTPTQWEVLCYLESIIICRDWKQLEIELINPEIINYVWQTSVYLDCWNIAIKEGGISIIQPSTQNHDKMLYISYALRNADGIKFYSKKNNNHINTTNK